MTIHLDKSFNIQLVITFFLTISIFIFSFPQFNKYLIINNITIAPIISGIILTLLIYLSMFIMNKSNSTILTGHTSPLYTLLCMLSNSVFGKDSIYSVGVTPSIGGLLIVAQLIGGLLAFGLLYLIYKHYIKEKNKE